MYWALVFFIWGIRDLFDAKPLSRNRDVYCLSGNVRKKYRHRRGVAFLLCSVTAAHTFVYERIYGIQLDFKSACLYCGIPYSILIIYMICLKKKYHVPGIWTKQPEKVDHN